ncbi:hypothetical protein MLD38_015460 [Melastoma candidum]|uniref:Uncharacterized protein n=1 Tax=Melastoma candidum TaxID=119954 RepID=A0ACB9RHC5_9MYRT|nr:hypothetical protein MLD38_015460 [Melastoma candidum]
MLSKTQSFLPLKAIPPPRAALPFPVARYSSVRERRAPPVDRPQGRPRNPSPNPGRNSLYARPSRAQMRDLRAENRESLYDFLRGIGIVLEELDGHELPVTAEVIRERVDFLRQLGLTVDDINDYPLVLGCSVKKNMVPVLDYLGKLGVRKSCLVDFLRRVLERYPEVLGFKLEGTMSTSIAYLVGIGVARREVGGLLTRYPEILGMRVGKVIKPFVEYLEYLGMSRLAVARLVEKGPHILGFDRDKRVMPNVESLLEFGVRRQSVSSVVAQYPEILGIELKPRLESQFSLLSSVVGLSRDEFGRVVERMPQVVSLSSGAVEKHTVFLKECGFASEQLKDMVVGCPQILVLNIDILRMSFHYLRDEMGRPLEDLVAFPSFFTYRLETAVKPRHRALTKKGIRCSLSWLLNCSDEKFRDRMEYDSIEIEEMEPASSFDMNSLTEPRSEDEGDLTEYEDDGDYDDSDEDKFT